jgi:hypothetical protein
MPGQRNYQRQNGDGKSWAQWKQDLSEAIEELDKACAKVRQAVYKLRPLVRPKGERGSVGPYRLSLLLRRLRGVGQGDRRALENRQGELSRLYRVSRGQWPSSSTSSSAGSRPRKPTKMRIGVRAPP